MEVDSVLPRLILPDLRRSIGPGRRTWHDRTYDRGRSNDKHRRVSSEQKGASATGVLDAFGNNPSLLDANHPAFRSSHSHVPHARAHARNTQRERVRIRTNGKITHSLCLPTSRIGRPSPAATIPVVSGHTPVVSGTPVAGCSRLVFSFGGLGAAFHRVAH